MKTTLSATDSFLIAVRNRDYKKCAESLLAGADVNAVFGVCAAVYNKPFGDPDACSDCGPNDTPLTHAIKTKDARLVKFLLKHKADPEKGNQNPICLLTPLSMAANNLDLPIVKLLLEFGADPTVKNKDELATTAMHWVFFGLNEWSLDEQEKAATELAFLFRSRGSSISFKEISQKLMVEHRDQPILIAAAKIWENTLQLYMQAVAVGILKGKLPPEVGGYVGTFLPYNTALRRTCKAAAEVVVPSPQELSLSHQKTDTVRIEPKNKAKRCIIC